MQNTKSKEDEIMLNDLLEEESILNIKKSNFESCINCIVNYKKEKLSFEELLALRSRFLLVLKNNTNYKTEQQMINMLLM